MGGDVRAPGLFGERSPVGAGSMGLIAQPSTSSRRDGREGREGKPGVVPWRGIGATPGTATLRGARNRAGVVVLRPGAALRRIRTVRRAGFPMPQESCLVTRLGRFVELNDDERDLLARMEENEVPMAAREVVLERGARADKLHVLKQGWAVVRSRPIRGRTHILRVYLPGEVVGLAELGCEHAHHRVVMQTEGVVCPFPRAGLPELMARTPRLSALLQALSSIDQIALRDQCVALGLMTAEDRLVRWLLQIHARLRVADPDLGDRFRLPFSQAEMGEAVGMTPVYVNKLLRKLSEEGRLRASRPYVELLDREGLAARVEFTDAFAELDRSWFPEAA